jgi:beta-glucosidase
MKRLKTTIGQMVCSATAAVFLAGGCLLPPGAVSLEIEEVGECIPPKSTVVPMHTREDIDWPTKACRQRVSKLMAEMSLEEKIGQMVQPDRGQLRNDFDLGTYHIGSVLNGGDSDPPGGNDLMSWAKMVAIGHQRSLDSKHRIPSLYAVDAVHGHNNVRDTVIFPHNIGLGCTRNPELMERVGRAAAEEIAATGIDWTLAPVLAAARDERWGRTYEAFGETPELAAELGAAMIRGLQGDRLGEGNPSVLACAKHFAGDGGTTNGIDRGNAEGEMAVLKQIHAVQYKAAVAAGVGSVMASYSRVNTIKMHCHGPLLTDTLKGEYGFNGFVVSDWEAVEKLPGGFKAQVAAAVNAGIDMVMAPKSYTGLINAIEKQVPDTIPAERVDDAVGRILSVKCELGMLDPGYFPRDGAGNLTFNEALLNQVGSRAHREVARQAVRESLVLLKNENRVLPLAKNLKKIVVAGRNADDLGHQCGGWTISWQGSTGAITRGTTILKAIKNAISPTGQGTEVVYSEGGSGAEDADVGVVVIGEGPYAELNGDRRDLTLGEEDLEAVRTVKAAGIPVVVILISGRPMILESALDDADAFIAAWLPGTEGDGVADVLFGDHPPAGKLGHSWPRNMEQIPINVGDAEYDPLFPYGYGLTFGGSALE